MSDEEVDHRTPQSFTVNLETNSFQLNLEDFVPRAGEVHYFRVPRDSWDDRLEKMKRANLNCVATAVNWSLHEKFPGLYDFEEQLDIAEFMRAAERNQLMVILKIGPQVGADCDFGGLPFWLLGVNPKMKCRAQDESFTYFFGRWLKYLYGQIQPHLVGKGGPIIMIQLEDAYGSFPIYDRNYLYWLRDVNRGYVGSNAVLFTSDFPSKHCLERGRIPLVHSTVKFGASNDSPLKHFEELKKLQPKGPLFNSQFWVGLATYWEDPTFNVMKTEIFEGALAELVASGTGFILHMFHGGTNFGLMSGSRAANQNCCTSYDFDAPISESGDLTEKYETIRKLLRTDGEEVSEEEDVKTASAQHELKEKGNYGIVSLHEAASITRLHDKSYSKSIKSLFPKSFEELGVKEGFVAYTTTLLENIPKGGRLKGLVKDRAYVIINMKYKVGIIEGNGFLELEESIPRKTNVTFLVESFGRRPYAPGECSRKGLFKMYINDIYLDKWTMTTYHFKNFPAIKRLFDSRRERKNTEIQKGTKILPSFYDGTFILPDVNPGEDWYHQPADGAYEGTVENSNGRTERKPSAENGPVPDFHAGYGHHKRSSVSVTPESLSSSSDVMDSFLRLPGWKRGVVYLNTRCLGRYWNESPQMTLYVPGSFFLPHPKKNRLVVFELEEPPAKLEVEFVVNPIVRELKKTESSAHPPLSADPSTVH